DTLGGSYPGELWPETVTSGGVKFKLGSSTGKNMVACAGQTIPLPAGDHSKLYLLAASAHGDRHGVFTVNSAAGTTHKTALTVQDWQALIGQWYSRVIHNDPADTANFGPGSGYPNPNWDGSLVLANMAVKNIRDGRVHAIEKLTPGFIKRDPIAWVGTHRHAPTGDLPYCFCYLFQYAIDLPAGATSVTLPNDPNIRVMAITAARGSVGETHAAGVLYEPDAFPPIVPRTPEPQAEHFAPGTRIFQTLETQTFDGKQDGYVKNDLAALPYQGESPWTINQFVYMDKQPAELTVIGGFGDGSDASGQERFLIKYKDSISFWGSNVDVPSGVPFDLGKWQMITLAFDGKTLTIYKNAQPIKSAPITLEDADDTVRIAAPGPWNDNRFAGKIARFTIWSSALSPAAIEALMVEMPN
ncbi:MAG: LamG domain-containing protein, partial [Janthinobacterium lividum]